MFCRTCGKELVEQATVCVGCGCPPLIGNAFCQACGAQTNPNAVACVACGVGLGQAGNRPQPAGGGTQVYASTPPKEPALMALCSFLIVGLGQMIMGQTAKGVTLLVAAIVIGALTLGLGALITLPVASVDAFLIAKKLKERGSVGQWEFF